MKYYFAASVESGPVKKTYWSTLLGAINRHAWIGQNLRLPNSYSNPGTCNVGISNVRHMRMIVILF